MPDYLYEQAARLEGYALVCGIDEAGRGPLAGPVCAAAVILPESCRLPGLDDSKKLTEKKWEALFPVILEQATAYSVAFATVEEIDALNILNATFLAMCRAVKGLQVPADFALVDGNQIPRGLCLPARSIVGGDGKSLSIAAASVLAKVSRDRLMPEVDRQYPGYGFAKHKGYGTKDHIAAIRELGPCPAHRRSFLRKILHG